MVLVFLADGFEEIEALTTVDVLRRAELEVVTVGIGDKLIRGAHGILVGTDTDDSRIPTKDLQAVVLPGGMPGTLHLEKADAVQQMIEFALVNGALIAAICAAPSILGHKGLLENRRAVCFPGFEEELCGAVSGGVLVLSLLHPHTDGEDRAGKVRLYAQAKEFRRRFQEVFGLTRCGDLLRARPGVTERNPASQRLGVTAHCDNMIVTAVEILEQMLQEEPA